jgi:fructokinase
MSPTAKLLAGVELGGTKCVCILASGPNDVREQVQMPTRTPAPAIQRASMTISPIG